MTRITTLAATLTTLVAWSLTAAVSADESERIWSLPGQPQPLVEQPPETAQAAQPTLMQSLQPQSAPGYTVQAWQPMQWPVQQPWPGQYPPGYAPGGQPPAYPQLQAPAFPQPQAPSYPQFQPPAFQQPQAPAGPQAAPAAVANPRDAELKRLQKQVAEQEDELNRANEMLASQYAALNEAYDRIDMMKQGESEVQEARARLEQMHAVEAELQEARDRIEQLHAELDAGSAREREQADRIDYLTRMENAVRVQASEMVESQRAAEAMREQQRQLISNYEAQNRQITEQRDQLRDALVRLNEQVNALQVEVMRALSDTLRSPRETP